MLTYVYNFFSQTLKTAGRTIQNASNILFRHQYTIALFMLLGYSVVLANAETSANYKIDSFSIEPLEEEQDLFAACTQFCFNLVNAIDPTDIIARGFTFCAKNSDELSLPSLANKWQCEVTAAGAQDGKFIGIDDDTVFSFAQLYNCLKLASNNIEFIVHNFVDEFSGMGNFLSAEVPISELGDLIVFKENSKCIAGPSQ